MSDSDRIGATLWTGVMFLRAAAEFSRLTPDRKTWNETALNSNLPRLVRYKRLVALAKAFDVKPDFSALFDGEFLSHRSADELEVVKQKILADVEENEPQLLSRIRSDHWRGWQGPSAAIVYAELVKALRMGYALNNGVWFASGVYLYPLAKAERLRNIIAQSLESIVEVFIAPDGRPRKLEELLALGWPADDLSSIDLDSE